MAEHLTHQGVVLKVVNKGRVDCNTKLCVYTDNTVHVLTRKKLIIHKNNSEILS